MMRATLMCAWASTTQPYMTVDEMDNAIKYHMLRIRAFSIGNVARSSPETLLIVIPNDLAVVR